MACVFVFLRHLSLSWIVLSFAVASLAGADNDNTAHKSQSGEPSPDIASSFDELQDRVRLGDTVYVTDPEGRVIEGKISSLNDEASSLTLEKASSKEEKKWGSGDRIDRWDSIEFTLADIEKVELRYKDSLVNGTLIGAGVAGGLVALTGIGADASAGEVAAVAAVWAGIGAAIGVGIDAAIKSRKVIYVSPEDKSGLQVFVTPVFSKTRKGLLIRLEF